MKFKVMGILVSILTFVAMTFAVGACCISTHQPELPEHLR